MLGLGFKEEHLRFKDHDKLAHYAKSACDIQYLFPMGWSELNGIHDRTDYDLSRHQEYSGKNMNYLDPATGEHYIPYVVEYSIGADRLMLAVLCEAYEEEVLEGGDVRTVMHFHPALAAYKAAVLPLQKNLGEKAREVYKKLSKKFMVTYDEAGSIGKRYRRQDEIGTPLLHHHRLRHAGKRHRHRARPRHDGADPPRHRRRARIHRTVARTLIGHKIPNIRRGSSPRGPLPLFFC